jgi:hypothetical protein
MKSLVVAILAMPLLGGTALAAESLNDQQMDGVTAGFTSISVADAEGLVGESGIALTATATLSQVTPIAVGQYLETTTFLFKAVAASQSSTVTARFNPQTIPVP